MKTLNDIQLEAEINDLEKIINEDVHLEINILPDSGHQTSNCLNVLVQSDRIIALKKRYNRT